MGHHLHAYIDFVIGTTCPADQLGEHHLGDTRNGLQHQLLYCHDPSKPIFSQIPVSSLLIDFPILIFIAKQLSFSELLDVNYQRLKSIRYAC